MLSSVSGTSGGTSDDQGIFLGDGIDLIQAVRKGELVDGTVITGIDFNHGSTFTGLNDFGQVAYTAFLADGRTAVQRFTPDLHWRNTTNGNWSDSSNWSLGLAPGEVHGVYLDSTASLTIEGPTSDASIRKLYVGGNETGPSQGLVTLQLQQGRTINAANGVIVESSGTMTGDGRVIGDVANFGRIVADNIVIDGPTSTLLSNGIGGRIEGMGRVHASIDNLAGGSIRANLGNVLSLTGSSLDNSGLIEVIGGEIVISANVQNNSSSGLIAGRDATMRFNGGVSNDGSMAFSFGVSDVFGDIDNNGIISIGGGAEATFYDDIIQNGGFEVVATGSRTSAAVGPR